MQRLIFLISILVLGIGETFSIAEAPAEYTKRITGRVFNHLNEPLQGATVIIKELNLGTVTGVDGAFSIEKLAPGVYNLVVLHVGYSALTIKVDLVSSPAWVELWLEPTFIELQEVVVRDQRSGIASKEHSLSIAAVNREYLSEQTGMTLMQLLQRMPGVQAMNIGTGISKPVIRGMSFNRVIVAENNIKQQGQQWGSDHGLEIDPYGVERVEVIKGPATLLFGSDGIGGAINIRPPVIPQENTLQAEALLAGKSNNDLIGTSVMTALNRNGNFFRVRASLQNYADYRVPADSFTYNNWIIPLAESRLKNTSGNDKSLAITAGIRRKWGISTITASNYSQKAGFFPGAHGVPNPSALAIAGNPRRTEYPMQKVNHLKLLWNSNVVLGKNWLEFDFGFQQNHRQELNPPHVHGAGPLPEGNTELELWLNTFSANIKLHQNISLNNVMVYGFSSNYQENKKGGYNFLLPDFRAADAGLFLINQRNLSSNFFFNTGIRADIARVDIAGYEEAVWIDSQTISHYQTRSPEFSKSYFNATANAGTSWLFSEGWNLKTNLGSSYRTPTPIELSANGIHHGSFRHEKGDTSLRPERAFQLDLGLIYNRTEMYFALSPFVNYFSNYLFLNPSGLFSPLPGGGQIYRFEQARALHLGSEAYIDWHLTQKLHSSLGAEIIWAQNLDDHYPLPFIPPSTLSLEVSYHVESIGNIIGKTKFLASIRSSAHQNRVARNEPATSGYTLVNLGFSTRFSSSGFVAEIDFHVQNLFDILYQNHLSFYRKLELPEPGRNFSLIIRFPFSRKNLNGQ